MTITFLTDYGLEDDFVGVCHGVMRRIAPDAVIIDVTHGVPRHGVREGALTLRNALPYTPAGVHIAVVDPQVGTERRAVALRCAEESRILVGPDNGLLALAWERFGGVVEAVDVSRSRHRLEPLSATFHGRDVFCPVGAALAAGEELADAGDPLDPRVESGVLVAHALIVDGYGNVALNVGHDEALAAGVRLGDTVRVNSHLAKVVQTFADVSEGELLLYEDAWRSLAVAVNRGDASEVLRLRPDDEVRLAPAG